jgi:hypothetical protein
MPASSLRVHVTWEEFEELTKFYRHTARGASGLLEWDRHPEVLSRFLSPEDIEKVQRYVERTGYLPELVPHLDPPTRRLDP